MRPYPSTARTNLNPPATGGGGAAQIPRHPHQYKPTYNKYETTVVKVKVKVKVSHSVD